jgi:hypothetical protein
MSSPATAEAHLTATSSDHAKAVGEAKADAHITATSSVSAKPRTAVVVGAQLSATTTLSAGFGKSAWASAQLLVTTRLVAKARVQQAVRRREVLAYGDISGGLMAPIVHRFFAPADSTNLGVVHRCTTVEIIHKSVKSIPKFCGSEVVLEDVGSSP